MSTVSRRITFGVLSALALGSIALWPAPRGALEPLAIEPQAVQQELPQPRAAGVTTQNAPVAARLPTAAAQPAVTPSPDKPQHPHPLTPEREALQHELRLVGALQDALDLQDVPTLRSLIARYRAHVPGDENKLAEGYARLADCLEIDAHDSFAVLAAAAAYYQNERASTLRRYIRRICLER